MWDEKGYYYELRYWKNRFDTQLLKLFMTVMEQIVAAMEEEGQAAGLKNRLSPDLFPLHYRVEAGKVNEAAGCELIPGVDEGEQIKAYILDESCRKQPFGAWGKLYIMDHPTLGWSDKITNLMDWECCTRQEEKHVSCQMAAWNFWNRADVLLCGKVSPAEGS